MPDNQDEPFLLRWSRRKRGDAANDAAADRSGSADTGLVQETATEGLADGPSAQAESVVTEQPVPEDLVDVDVATLDYSSDFERFMRDDVPDALRRQALRQLWRSDPVLANLDGLCDYDDDFTDAALAVKVLETAHKVGRGFLDDEDLDDTNQASNGETAESAAAEGDHASTPEEATVADADGVAAEPDGAASIAPDSPSSDATEPVAVSNGKDQSAA